METHKTRKKKEETITKMTSQVCTQNAWNAPSPCISKVTEQLRTIKKKTVYNRKKEILSSSQKPKCHFSVQEAVKSRSFNMWNNYSKPSTVHKYTMRVLSS